MRYLVLLLAVLLLTGCDERTVYGECWGLAEDQDSTLTYSYDKSNIVVGVIFAETIIIPAIIVGDMLKCPDGRR